MTTRSWVWAVTKATSCAPDRCATTLCLCRSGRAVAARGGPAAFLWAVRELSTGAVPPHPATADATSSELIVRRVIRSPDAGRNTTVRTAAVALCRMTAIRATAGKRSEPAPGGWDDAEMRTLKLVPRDLNDAAIRIPIRGLVREESVNDHDRGDAALVEAARRGSETALATLFHRYWPAAERAAYLVCHDRGGAEDIAQDAFLAAIGSLERFDRRRPFAPWLHRIVVNRAIDFTRMRAARRETSTAVLPEPRYHQSAEPDHEVLAALAHLDPNHRAVIVMRYVLDLSPGEIAQALELPRGTVNSRLRRGLDALGDLLDRGQERVP